VFRSASDEHVSDSTITFVMSRSVHRRYDAPGSNIYEGRLVVYASQAV
jgi:hypothetical protein